MKKFLFFLLTGLLSTSVKAQKIDSIIVHYYENFPYAYTEGGSVKGIEVDIVNEYVSWLKQKKNITVAVQYKPFSEFSALYNSLKSGSAKTLGLGSIAYKKERENEVTFSPPYLRNVSVLISQGTVPTVRTKDATDVSKVLGNLEAYAVKGSTHNNYLNGLKKESLPNLKIITTESQNAVLDNISKSKNSFGYVDIIAYWSYLRNNPTKFLKMHKVFSESNEYLAIAMPKNGSHEALLHEFFESGFGFTSTKAYRTILEKYLGHEIIESVEIN
jgi:ABC-type amino acid transport substrate-binding protein